jgi:hypothetical protein
MPHGVIGQPVLFVPGGGGPMQPGDAVGTLPPQTGLEQVGEQLMMAPPAAHPVQRLQEQVGPLHLLQQRLAVGPAGDRVAQGSRQSLQHRGLQQEPDDLLWLAGQHLFGQVVQHVPVAAAEAGHEPGRVGVAVQ